MALLWFVPSTALATALPSTIKENTTLTPAGNPYTGGSTIESGVTVKVEPGVKFAGASFTVKGALVAQGTAKEPIVFEGKAEAAVTFESGSGASVLDHVEIEKAGVEACCAGARPAVLIRKASPTISNSTFRTSGWYAIQILEGGSPEIANNSFINGENTAVYYFASSAGQTGQLNIHGNTVEAGANTKYGGGIEALVSGASITSKNFSGNSVTGTPGSGIVYTGSEVPSDITENTLSGNKVAGISVTGTVANSATWGSIGQNIKLGGVTIASGVTLSVTAGVVFTESSFTVNGVLDAEGSVENPVVLEGNGGSAVVFESGSGASVLNHVEVLNAGHEGVYASSRPAVEVKKSSPTIKNSTFRKSGYYAIWAPEGGSPEIANNGFLNGWITPIYYRATTGQTGEVNVHGNLIESGANTKYGGGIDISVTGSSVTAKTLSGNTVIGTPGFGLNYVGPEVPGDITENTLSGNKNNVIEVSGTVAKSSTWNNGGSKVKINSVTVASGVTLSVTAGVVFTESSFTVNGTLAAEGTTEQPIVFEEKGQTAVTFESGSGASVLNHVEIEKGGVEACCLGSRVVIAIKKSSPTITNSIFRTSGYYAIQALEGGSPEIANNQFLNGWITPIYYRATTGQTGEVNVHGNLIEAGTNTKYGGGIDISVTGSSVTAKTLSGNTVIGTPGVGLSYSGPDIPGDITENTLSANKTNLIEVGGIVAHSSTWNPSPSKVKLNGVTIASGSTLSISPGVVLGEAQITVNGTLVAEGTAEKPIVLEGKAAAAVTFESGSGASVLNHVAIEKAGVEACCAGARAAVVVRKASPTISNSTFRASGYYGIQVSEGGSPEIANNYFLNGENTAIYLLASSGQKGEVNIHGNYIEAGANTKYGGGIAVSASASGITAKTLSGNTVIGTPGTGISYSGPEIPGDITENTLSGNAINIIEISGTVAHSSTWNDGGSRVRFGGVTVASGVTLKITKGVILQNPSMTVKGTLLAEGTAEKPVVFTGAKEEKAGEWSYISFEPGSGESVVDHAEVAYGGQLSNSGMIEVRGSHPTITNSTIRKSSYYGIKVTESGNPRIEWNRFRSNTNGLSYTGTGTLSAPNNDWNCANGPKPAGCGDSVTTNVGWKPAVQLPELAGHCRGKESQCGEGADPVSLATGQLNYSHQDLLLTNKSAEPLEFTRAYYSGSSSDTGMGPGWSQSGLASAMELESGEVFVLRQDGRQDVFYKSEGGYEAPSGVTDTLTKVEGTFQLTTLQGTVYRFDSSGRIASITDSHGLKTTYAYNGEKRLTTITDPSSQTLTFAYNASNHITSVKDSTGREVKFGYSAGGDLETVTDALGGVTKYAYDAQHRLTSITDPRGNVILKNIYNGEGKITEQEDGLKNLWKLEYKPSETIVTEPQGGKRKYGFDAQERVMSETDQLGHTTTTSYDEAGNVHEVTQPGGAKWVYSHDAAGNLTSVKDPEGGERSFKYNAQNRLIAFTDARGNAWSAEWSKAGDLEKMTDPEKGETTFTYNESGQPLKKTDPDKHKTEFAYDTSGNRTSETDPLGHKTSYEYNSRNYLTAKTLPGLKAEKLERDALGDLLSRTTPEGHATKYAYDKNGLPTQITDPGENVWAIEYNAMERPTVYTDPLGQEAKVSYNGNLKPTKVVNRRGKETNYAYDLANRLTEVDRPEGEDWSFGYDSRGNRTRMIDPLEHETAYEFDLLNRMTKASEPLEATTEYGYDTNGDLTSVKDPRGNTTSYGYDKLGRLTEVAQPLEETTTYSYDAASNPLTKTTAAGTLDYEHDAANRLTAILAGETTLRSYAYDAADRRTSATDAEGHKIEIGYNEDSLPSSIKDGRGQSLARTYNSRGALIKQVDGRGTLEYGYDKLGRLTSLIDPQGKSLGFGYNPENDLTEVTRPNGVTTTNVYNDAGRLAETTSIKAGEPPVTLESLEYGYNAAGNVTSKIDQRLEAEATYSYDALNRLAEFNPPGEGATSYGYDKAGNRTEAGGVTSTFNALNQITEASDGSSYGYDGAGRLTSMAKGEEETTFGWDLFDHLATVEGPGGTASYAYDALERLSERKGSGGTLAFHYGDLSDLPTYAANGEGETMTSYVQGAHGLIEQRSGKTTSYPLRDAHGDVTAIANEAGEVASRQSYDPWGAQLSGPSIEMGYLGAQQRRFDSTSGLIQMGARSYSPTLGSFMSEDPVLGQIGLGIASNRYPYVWDNPLGLYDLDGRFPSPGDIAGSVGDAVDDTWNVGKELVTHPGESSTNAVEYWAGSESPASYVFGPLSVLGDGLVNPSRAAYYLEKANPAQMAATGILVAGSAGLIVVTAEATADCVAVTAGFDALHACGQLAAFGGAGAATAGALAVEVAKR